VLVQPPIAHLLRAPASIVNALQLEQVFQLVFERNRDLEELHTAASKGTLQRVEIEDRRGTAVTLPAVNADPTEDIAALRAFLWVAKQVLTHLAHEVIYQIGITVELDSFQKRFSGTVSVCRALFAFSG